MSIDLIIRFAFLFLWASLGKQALRQVNLLPIPSYSDQCQNRNPFDRNSPGCARPPSSSPRPGIASRKEGSVIPKVYAAADDITGVEFGPILSARALAAKYVSIIAMVAPRFLLPSWQFAERYLLRAEPNAYQPARGLSIHPREGFL
jgi:hypothetical protein